MSTASVLCLPTAADALVVNPPRRGRYPKGVTPIWRGRALRGFRESREAERSGSLKEGDYVMVWQSHATNSNNGRVGRVMAQSDHFAQVEAAWQVEAVGSLFDIGGKPENGKTAAAIFRDGWLLPMSADAARFYDSTRAGR